MSAPLAHLGPAARIVLRQIRAHPEQIETVEDIPRLHALAPLQPWILDDAIDHLVAVGAITEAADGRLCVHPRRTA